MCLIYLSFGTVNGPIPVTGKFLIVKAARLHHQSFCDHSRNFAQVNSKF